MTIPSGYDPFDYYFASRFRQGGRWVYGIDLSLPQLAAYLPKPDPDRPTEDNRRIKLAHARGFAQYIRDNRDWVSPALLLRAPDIFTFEVKEEVAGTQFGLMGVPKNARSDIRIIDGQHRTLGVHLALEAVSRALEEARNNVARARKLGEALLEAEHQKTVETLTDERNRLSSERLPVQIIVVEDVAEARRIFVDIADNALGITSAVRARFDDRKIVNRTLEEVMKHALLNDRVDLQQDRVKGNSPYLMGAKHVVDIVRTVAVGIDGRIGKRKEQELNEGAMVQGANEFLDALVTRFSPLEKVTDGAMTPAELRDRSLLGSVVMQRVLAGVWFDLADGGKSPPDISEFFSALAPYMDAPVMPKPGDMWYDTGLFPDNPMGAYGPTSRSQDLRKLVSIIASWEPAGGSQWNRA